MKTDEEILAQMENFEVFSDNFSYIITATTLSEAIKCFEQIHEVKAIGANITGFDGRVELAEQSQQAEIESLKNAIGNIKALNTFQAKEIESLRKELEQAKFNYKCIEDSYMIVEKELEASKAKYQKLVEVLRKEGISVVFNYEEKNPTITYDARF